MTCSTSFRSPENWCSRSSLSSRTSDEEEDEQGRRKRRVNKARRGEVERSQIPSLHPSTCPSILCIQHSSLPLLPLFIPHTPVEETETWALYPSSQTSEG
jgi:hypothetical protein